MEVNSYSETRRAKEGISWSHQFWDAVQRRDFFAAARIVDKYDNPFFEYANHPKGFHPVRQAAIEVFGRGSRWMRPPQPSLNNQEMDELRVIFDKMGLLQDIQGLLSF